MDKLTVDMLPTMAEEQLIEDELEQFANSMKAFHHKQKHNKVFFDACAESQYFDVASLIKAKTDINQADEDGRTAMHHASASVS